MLDVYYLPIVYVISLIIFCYLTQRFNLIAKPDAVVLARQSPIDGLRSLLATSVMAFHFYINYGFGKTGLWQSPSHYFLLNMGAVPVSLFFMITGYLFIHKLKQPTTNSQSVYIGRIKRIYPLYLLLAVLSVLIILLQNNFAINVNQLSKWLVGWLWFDVKPFKVFFAKPLIVGAVWTLIYEWAFYSALPLLAVLLHKNAILMSKISYLSVPRLL